MAKYVMQESAFVMKDKKKRLFPRLIGVTSKNHDELVEYISNTTGMQSSMIVAVLDVLAERMATWMGQGCSIKIDNMGRFTPILGLKKGVEREESCEEGELDEYGRPKSVHRNATSIEVNNVGFVPDRRFLKIVNDHLDLERSPYQKTIRPNECGSTEEERLQMLVGYLKKNTFINCASYIRLIGLKRTAATNELRKW